MAQTDSFIDQARNGVRQEIDRHGIVGASAALIIDGAPVWVECFGTTGGKTPAPVDPDTIFSIQSTSKHVCATAIMLAVQQGLLDLDRPLSAYLPDFTVNSRYEADPIGAMSLRALLSHRAGFTHEAPVGNNFIPASPSFEAHIRSIQHTWLRYPIGERYSYSNLGIDLAGYVLERESGLPYAACLRQWVFEPQGMRSTTASADVYVANPNRAVGHQPGFDDIPVRIPIIPSGGVYTSIDDLVRYAQFHLNRGRSAERQLLDESLWQEMHAFRYGSDYALGVARIERRLRDRNIELLTHNGGGFGFGSSFIYDPAEGLGWIVLFNGVTTSAAFPEFDPIMPGPILEARYGPPRAPAANTRPVKTLAPDLLESRIGQWRTRLGGCETTIVDGQLCVDAGAAGINRLDFTSDDDAWVVDGPAKGAAVRFHAKRGFEAQHFEMPLGTHWDFVDGPSVPPGPVDSEYDAWLGDYEIRIWGKPVQIIKLSKKNGYVYFDDMPTTPFRPGVLFAGVGEALDLTGEIPTAASVQLIRTA
jgi:CubicO group peptidase (beta-lactamase class C family)